MIVSGGALVPLKILISGKIHNLHLREGQSYRDEIRRCGLPLVGECDGAMICATCQIVLDEAWVHTQAAGSDEEQDLLETLEDYSVGSRLSCQTLVEQRHAGLTLRLPNSSIAS